MAHSGSVIKVIYNSKKFEIYSLDLFGKVILWNIIELSNEEAERNYVDFGKYAKIKVMIKKILFSFFFFNYL